MAGRILQDKPGAVGALSDDLHEVEARFAAVVESNLNGLVVVDDAGIVRFANRTAAAMLGTPPADLLHEPFFRPVAPGTSFELEGRAPDGDPTVIEVRVGPTRWDGAEAALLHLRDIGALRAEQRAARELGAQAGAILENAADGIITIDQDGIIQVFNRAAERIFGYGAGEVTGKSVNMLMPRPFADAHDAHLAAYLKGGPKRIIGTRREVAGMRKDGSVFPMELHVSEIRQGDRRLFIGVLRDITARKRAEAALEHHRRELERSNAELEQFAYVASHDLQEPLRMVAGFTQLLAKRYTGCLGPEADEFIGYAVDGARRMQELINDLLAFSRVGTRESPRAPTDVGDVLTASLANLKAAIEESGARVTHDPLPTVTADRVQLVQLFQNLIGNAIKYRSDRPLEVHVGVARPEPGLWRFAVRDNGIGIDPDHAERIFMIFQRLHARSRYPGTGIGLAICKKIVERHGGRIGVESTPGGGATFVFTLAEPG